MLLKHFSTLKQCYSLYSSNDENENIITSKSLWEFFWDCKVISSKTSIVLINRLLMQGARGRFTLAEVADGCEHVHSENRPVLFRQFLDAIIRAAYLKYSNGGILRSKVKRVQKALVETPKTQLGIAVTLIIKKKILPNVGNRREYIAKTNLLAKNYFDEFKTQRLVGLNDRID